MKNEEITKMKNVERRTQQVLKTLLLATLLILPSSLFIACGESDDSPEEFPDWKNRNETYFNQLYTTVSAEVAAGNSEWKIIRNWSLPDDENFAVKPTGNILVKVVREGSSPNPAPLYNDTVHVSYCGRMLPSTSYANGKVFDDKMGQGTDPQTFTYVKSAVNGFVDGFSTALMHMRIGDHWQVYIPYQLAYGEDGLTETVDKVKHQVIPGYSTLIFDVYLKAYFHPGKTAPAAQAKTSAGEWAE